MYFMKIATKISRSSEATLDYGVGDSTRMLSRREVLQKVNPVHKDRILYMLDLMLKATPYRKN